MKIEVPPAPVSALPFRVPSAAQAQRSEPKFAQPLDANFLRRSLGWTLVLGGCLALAAGAATNSSGVASSLAIGAGAGAALLGSEMALMGRILSAVADARRQKSSSKRLLLGILWVAKWIPVGLALMWLLKTRWFAPLPFALGCTVFQVVIFAKVLGRVLVSR